MLSGVAYDDRLLARWQSDKEIPQREARAAEARAYAHLSEQAKTAGLAPLDIDVEKASRQIYRTMSKAAHHQRSVVDRGIQHAERQTVFEADPREHKRIETIAYAGLVIQETALVVGNALTDLWGPPFYAEHLEPVLSDLEKAANALRLISLSHALMDEVG